MPRNYRTYLKDILEAAEKIEKYTKNTDLKKFEESELIQDGVVRNLEIIGEAVKNIPDEIKEKNPEIEWEKNIRNQRSADTCLFWG